MRYVIVALLSGEVVNVVEYATAPGTPPDGYDEEHIAVRSDEAGFTWTWDGGSLVPPAPIGPSSSAAILSQDLMAQFTADDAAKIQAAVAGNAQFWLLWSAMQAQKDPMIVTNARFLSGWNALIHVLGQPRMMAIAAALNVTID